MAESYTVLARRYRSQNFDELVGQEAIAQTLKNAILTNRVAHAFLFTGTRGVGKTSSARILAKALNCPDAKDGQPCGVCPTCLAIARGEDMDVIEIDGASNNGVDQVRELRASAGIRPARSRYKIYIIDEVHMLSTGAFNALLKTLEEPPEHVKFIFATTDVHKVPATIISRVQRFDFKNIPTAKIADHLRKICADEGVRADDDALHRIARLANGSMRDGLSLLDRVLSLGEKHITEKLLEDLLGKPPTAAIAELVDAIARGDAGTVLTRADALIREGMGPEQLLGELIEFLRNLMLLSVCGPTTDILDVPTDQRAVYTGLTGAFDAATLVHLIALCEQTLRSLKSTTMGRPLFDALVVRLAMSEQFSSLRSLLSPEGQKKNDMKGGAVGEAVSEGAVAPVGAVVSMTIPVTHRTPVAATAAVPVPVSSAPAVSAAAEVSPGAVAEGGSVFQQLKASLGKPVGNGNGAGGASGSSTPVAEAEFAFPAVPPTELPQIWALVRKHLVATKNGSINTILGPVAQLVGCDPATGEAALAIPGHQAAYAKDRPRMKIEESLAALFQRPMHLELVTTDDTAAREEAARAAETARTGVAAVQRIPPELKDAVVGSPIIRTLIERLGGDVTHIEILESESDTPAG